DKDARFRIDLGGDFVQVGLEFVLLRQNERNCLGSEAACERWIDREPGVWIEDFVAGLDESHHGKGEGHFAAGSDQDVFWLNIYAPAALEVGGNFFAQGRNTARGAVAIAASSDRAADCIYNGRSRMKVRFAELQVNDGAALFFQLLRARKNGKRAFAV